MESRYFHIVIPTTIETGYPVLRFVTDWEEA